MARHSVVLSMGTDVFEHVVALKQPDMTHDNHPYFLGIEVKGDDPKALEELGHKIVRLTMGRPQPVRMIGEVKEAA